MNLVIIQMTLKFLIDAGFQVNTINGEENNFKITNKNDFLRAQNMIGNQNIFKVGQGIDIHAFINGRNFKLFGANIPFNKTIKAHSDGDVGIHALIDAIIGTLSSGDIDLITQIMIKNIKILIP